MTKEEAIKVLKEFAPRVKPFYEPFRTKYPKAIDMAIESLSAEPNCQKCAIKELWKETEKEDLVSVVRCGDCRHQPYCMEEGLKEFWAEPIEWCSRGERREEL